MAAPTEVYVDPAIAADSGSGTIGDPYGDLQFALNSVTRDSTNGDRFNIKAGTAEVLSSGLSLATYGSPDDNAPLIIQGYTSAAGDGGVCDINGNAGNFSLFAAALNFTRIIDGILRNTGTAELFNLSSRGQIARCLCHTSTASQLFSVAGFAAQVRDSDIRGYSQGFVVTSPYALIDGCHISHAGGGSNLRGLDIAGNGGIVVQRCTFDVAAAVDAVYVRERGSRIQHNSFLGSSSTAAAIHLTSAADFVSVVNNLFEGWSGAGGAGIEVDAGGHIGEYGFNAFYNNTDHTVGVSGAVFSDLGDNESLGATPYAKSGANTFANRGTYFEPQDVGNVRGGAFPVLLRLDKGAVQHADPAGGGTGFRNRGIASGGGMSG